MRLAVFTMHTAAYMHNILGNTHITMVMLFMDLVKPGYPLSSVAFTSPSGLPQDTNRRKLIPGRPGI